jgi:hypothetical protein
MTREEAVVLLELVSNRLLSIYWGGQLTPLRSEDMRDIAECGNVAYEVAKALKEGEL